MLIHGKRDRKSKSCSSNRKPRRRKANGTKNSPCHYLWICKLDEKLAAGRSAHDSSHHQIHKGNESHEKRSRSKWRTQERRPRKTDTGSKRSKIQLDAKEKDQTAPGITAEGRPKFQLCQDHRPSDRPRRPCAAQIPSSSTSYERAKMEETRQEATGITQERGFAAFSKRNATSSRSFARPPGLIAGSPLYPLFATRAHRN